MPLTGADGAKIEVTATVRSTDSGMRRQTSRWSSQRGTYLVEDWDGIGAVRTVGYPGVFGRYGRPRADGPAPVLGADTVAAFEAH